MTIIPVGSGNSDRLMSAVGLLKPQVIALTPSYALHLAEWARDHGLDAAETSIERIMVAGEPGGGEPAMRAKLERAWHAQVTEAMGIGDIAVSLWGECREQQGMHFGGRGLVHFELIDPDSGKPRELADGVEGELVYTHLDREAAPLLRFRSRDHVKLWTGRCACGRTSPRIRCIGRTDDMLIVRGVNVFPTALREMVNAFAPAVSGVISVRPRRGAPAGPAVEGAGRARRGHRPPTPISPGRSAAASARRCSSTPRSADAVRLAAAERVQVELGRLVRGGLSWNTRIRRATPPWRVPGEGPRRLLGTRHTLTNACPFTASRKPSTASLILFQLASVPTFFSHLSMFG